MSENPFGKVRSAGEEKRRMAVKFAVNPSAQEASERRIYLGRLEHRWKHGHPLSTKEQRDLATFQAEKPLVQSLESAFRAAGLV